MENDLSSNDPLARHSDLVNKKYLQGGLSLAEEAELEQLEKELDSSEVPFYEKIVNILTQL
jgi:hypothetical protein